MTHARKLRQQIGSVCLQQHLCVYRKQHNCCSFCLSHWCVSTLFVPVSHAASCFSYFSCCHYAHKSTYSRGRVRHDFSFRNMLRFIPAWDCCQIIILPLLQLQSSDVYPKFKGQITSCQAHPSHVR